MDSRRILIIALAVVAVLGLWALSGLGRAEVDPHRFFTQAQIDRANAYRTPLYWAYAGRLAISLGLLALLAFTPLGSWLGWFRGRPWLLGAAGAAAALVLLRAVTRLPFSFWAGHLHEKAWGFSTQSAAGWFGDLAKALGVTLVVSVLAYGGFVALVRWLPRLWPVVVAAGGAILVVLFSFIWPVLVEPLFHRFEPLGGTRAAELRTLSQEAGVPVDRVLVADASRRTIKENAYVSGLGKTRRLVVYDTLLRNPFDEVRLVVAHELGHRRAGHVLKGTLIGAASAAGGVLILWLVTRSPALLGAAGARGPADPRLLPLLLLVVAVIGIVTQPPGNWMSRRFEEQADRFALALAGDREVYVRTERGLALRNLGDLDPGPVAYRFLFTHPPAPERISYAFED